MGKRATSAALLRTRGFFVTWWRAWRMAYPSGWNLARRVKWATVMWNRNGRGKHFVS